jgi:hypothetical protein
MVRSILLAGAAAAGTLLAGYSSAIAQVAVEVGPMESGYRSYYYDDGYRYRGPRVYGYYRDDDEDVVVRRPSFSGGCGTYRYWNGYRCVDARNRPSR